MAGVNKVILLGNLGKDPEVRHLENGRAVANFSLATSETYKNKAGERVTTTEWHNIVLWTPFAEIAEKYLKKGSQIYLEGKLTSRSYEDKDGITKYITEVVGREMTMLGSRTEGNGGSAAPSASYEVSDSSADQVPVAPVSEEVDDLPF